MANTEMQQFLAEQTLFAGLDDEQVEILAGHARERDLDPDETVASQGGRAEKFYLIVEGELVIEVPALTGPKLEITRLGTGEVFGWSWLIAPYEWHFNARASGQTKVLEFDGK